jgi:hypothetical protein
MRVEAGLADESLVASWVGLELDHNLLAKGRMPAFRLSEIARKM